VTHPDGRQDEYAHDAARNLLTKPGLTSGRTDVPPGMYAWDTTRVGLTANRLYRANGDRFFYDTRDHLSAREGAWGRLGYEHDALDRLRRVTFAARDPQRQAPEPVGREERHEHVYGAPETVWEANYDALGRRTETRVYGAVDASGERACARSRFWWHGDRLAAEEGPTGSLRVYVYADDRALVPFMAVDYASREDAAERPEDGERYYYFADHRGCPERVEDDRGQAVWEATIHPYGECEVHIGADFHQPLRFPGHYHDAPTGLHSNRFRYYSPELGRYLESDPVGIQGGLNLYAYCAEGNPLRDVDLRGLACPDDCESTPAPEEGAAAEGTAPPGTRRDSDGRLRYEPGHERAGQYAPDPNATSSRIPDHRADRTPIDTHGAALDAESPATRQALDDRRRAQQDIETARLNGDEAAEAEAQTRSNRATEQLGEQAADAWAAAAHPDAALLPTGRGPGTFDRVYENPPGSRPPQYIIIEAKGGSSSNSSSRIGADEQRHQQGTTGYRDSVARHMRDSPSSDAATSELGRRLLVEGDPDRIAYVEVSQPVAPDGSLRPIQARSYSDRPPSGE
jgi:RHS repeat-associated protein